MGICRRARLKRFRKGDQEFIIESRALPDEVDSTSAFSLPFRQPVKQCHAKLLAGSEKFGSEYDWETNTFEEDSQDQSSYLSSASVVDVQNNWWAINTIKGIPQGWHSYSPTLPAMKVKHGVQNSWKETFRFKIDGGPSAKIMETAQGLDGASTLGPNTTNYQLGEVESSVGWGARWGEKLRGARELRAVGNLCGVGSLHREGLVGLDTRWCDELNGKGNLVKKGTW